MFGAEMSQDCKLSLISWWALFMSSRIIFVQAVCILFFLAGRRQRPASGTVVAGLLWDLRR